VIQADATANHYKFTGKERDPETGVDYFFARYYSSALGRFLTPDWSATPMAVPYAKLGDPQSLNLYSYVENNPITGIDPDGHMIIGQFNTWHPDEGSGWIFEPSVTNSTFSWAMWVDPATGQAVPPPQQQPQGQSAIPSGPGRAGDLTGTVTEPAQRLGFKTISGGKGSSTWVIQWKLSAKSKNAGWIVQHSTATDASGNQLKDFWEAWQVPANSQYTKYYPDPADDTFAGLPTGTKVNAQAIFYEGLTLPSSFVPNNSATWAGILPSTTVNPHLPLPPMNVTVPVNRTWTCP
jgi:RHS repeat-associated protein